MQAFARARVIRRCSLIWLGCLLCALSAGAQTSRGTVSGLVTDPTGAVIPSASITLTNTLTGVARATVSNGEGLYRFDAVDLGTYAVKVAAQNFNTVVKNQLAISANQIAQVDVQLALGTQGVQRELPLNLLVDLSSVGQQFSV